MSEPAEARYSRQRLDELERDRARVGGRREAHQAGCCRPSGRTAGRRRWISRNWARTACSSSTVTRAPARRPSSTPWSSPSTARPAAASGGPTRCGASRPPDDAGHRGGVRLRPGRTQLPHHAASGASNSRGLARRPLVTKQAEVALWERTGCSPDDEGKPLASEDPGGRRVHARVAGLLVRAVPPGGRPAAGPLQRAVCPAGSDKREEILRQLFRTERFRELEMRLARAGQAGAQGDGATGVAASGATGLVAAADESELAVLTEEASARVDAVAREVEEQAAAAAAAAEILNAATAAVEACKAVAEAHEQLGMLRRGATRSRPSASGWRVRYGQRGYGRPHTGFGRPRLSGSGTRRTCRRQSGSLPGRERGSRTSPNGWPRRTSVCRSASWRLRRCGDSRAWGRPSKACGARRTSTPPPPFEQRPPRLRRRGPGRRLSRSTWLSRISQRSSARVKGLLPSSTLRAAGWTRRKRPGAGAGVSWRHALR